MMMLRKSVVIVTILLAFTLSLAQDEIEPLQPVEYDVISGARPHDVAPALESGIVWYTAQRVGALGVLDPETGEARHIPLGSGSAPHGVIVGPDGAAWITDSGLNAIVRVDAETEEVEVYPLPSDAPNANLNTATFDGDGVLWFTGQNGIYGRFDPETEEMTVFSAPRGRGPYGITTTPDGEATILEPPTPNQGARRVWSDSQGRIWVSEWDAGQLGMYDPETETWEEWALPGNNPRPYSVYVDVQDGVWLSDFSANALVRFDPQTEIFEVFPLPSAGANVRQMLGREGEVWAAESGTDKLALMVLEPDTDEEE
jgi:virginiamycin B lyase